MSRTFRLTRGQTILGVVTLDANESDFPWLVGWLEPSPAYATVRALFEELNRVLDEDGFDERSGELHEQVMAPGVKMVSLADGDMAEVTGLNISGNRVSWR